MKNDKRRSKSLASRIRKVLLRDWDPCGVGENPNLADEYDRYVEWLAEMSKPGEELSVHKVSETLEKFEMEWMGGLAVDCRSRQVVAQKLFLILSAAPRHRND